MKLIRLIIKDIFLVLVSIKCVDLTGWRACSEKLHSDCTLFSQWQQYVCVHGQACTCFMCGFINNCVCTYEVKTVEIKNNVSPEDAQRALKAHNAFPAKWCVYDPSTHQKNDWMTTTSFTSGALGRILWFGLGGRSKNVTEPEEKGKKEEQMSVFFSKKKKS